MKLGGFVETGDVIRRNLGVTFVATDGNVTVDNARKHITLLETAVIDSDYKLEVNIISDLLNGKLGKLRQLIGSMGCSSNCGKLVETINAYQMVVDYGGNINQETLFKNVIKLAGHIIDEITDGCDDNCDKIEVLLREQISMGMYDATWLKQKVANL